MKPSMLVTGGAGFVGTTLIPTLLEAKHNVTVFDSLMYKGDVLLPFFRNSSFTFIKGDVRDSRQVEDACKGKDVIVHLAAVVGYPACREHPELAEATNYGGSVNVANCCSKEQYILFGSTGSHYGKIQDIICTEETTLNPITLYGTTKTRAEKYLLGQGNCTAFRFATAFGLSPRMRLDLLINDMTYQASRAKFAVVYESHFRRTFIHVYDMARSFLFAIENHDKMIGNVYNAGSEKMNLSKKEVCEIIAKKTGAYFHFAEVGSDEDKRDYEVSFKKIRELGFETTISVEQGVDELVKGLEVLKVTNPYSNV